MEGLDSLLIKMTALWRMYGYGTSITRSPPRPNSLYEVFKRLWSSCCHSAPPRCTSSIFTDSPISVMTHEVCRTTQHSVGERLHGGSSFRPPSTWIPVRCATSQLHFDVYINKICESHTNNLASLHCQLTQRRILASLSYQALWVNTPRDELLSSFSIPGSQSPRVFLRRSSL